MVKKGSDKATWKANYFLKFLKIVEEYPKCFLVNVDNVSSKQMQQIRQSMRGTAEVLMGKNTMIRKAIRGHLVKNPALEKLLPYIVGNVGFVFTKDDLMDIKEKILSNRVAAPAKVGSIAPIDVSISAQNTGMGPEKTSFFQALNIPTKISRGTIEILSPVQIVFKGEKVGASESALLGMLGVKPFSYGLTIERVYDSGTIFEPEILDITSEDLRNRFMEGVRNIAALSLSINYPTKASVPHSIINGLKNLFALAAVTDINFKQAEQLKEFLLDPSKALAAAAAAAPPPTADKENTPPPPPEPEGSDDDEDMGLSLFD